MATTANMTYDYNNHMLTNVSVTWDVGGDIALSSATFNMYRNNVAGKVDTIQSGNEVYLLNNALINVLSTFTKVNNTYTNSSLPLITDKLNDNYTYVLKFTYTPQGGEQTTDRIVVYVPKQEDATVPDVGVPGIPTDTDNPETTFDKITGEEFITRYAIRQRISDAIETGYTDDELLAYINDAINMAWGVMIQMDYDEIAGYITMKERKIEIPKDYWMPTSKPPVQRYNHMLYCYGDLPCTFRYWTRPKFLRTLQDTLPQGAAWFNSALLNLIAQIVVTLAMQNHGFDMGSEMDFTTSIAKLLPK
jgi:hypothetical protein